MEAEDVTRSSELMRWFKDGRGGGENEVMVASTTGSDLEMCHRLVIGSFDFFNADLSFKSVLIHMAYYWQL